MNLLYKYLYNILKFASSKSKIFVLYPFTENACQVLSRCTGRKESGQKLKETLLFVKLSVESDGKVANRG